MPPGQFCGQIHPTLVGSLENVVHPEKCPCVKHYFCSRSASTSKTASERKCTQYGEMTQASLLGRPRCRKSWVRRGILWPRSSLRTFLIPGLTSDEEQPRCSDHQEHK